MDHPTCAVSECDKPTRTKSASLCRMHYHRHYRHGDVNLCADRSGITVSNGRKYKTTHKPDHPLAGPSGRVYVHRVVLFDKIGPGKHACHWCGIPLEWAAKGEPNAIVVDHLNSSGDDNTPENLVPSCGTCNTARGSQARANALRESGWWAQNDTISRLTGGGRKAPVGVEGVFITS